MFVPECVADAQLDQGSRCRGKRSRLAPALLAGGDARVWRDGDEHGWRGKSVEPAHILVPSLGPVSLPGRLSSCVGSQVHAECFLGVDLELEHSYSLPGVREGE